MTGFPKAVRAAVLARAAGWCERCGAAEPVEVHHRRPRGMGGSKAADTNSAANALALCGECHRVVESDRDDATQFGWLIRQGVQPASVPVLRRGQWCRLTDSGHVFVPPGGASRCVRCGHHTLQGHSEGCHA